MPRLAGLLNQWGMDRRIRRHRCHGAHIQSHSPVAVPPYPAHAITNNFGFITAFPLRARVAARDLAAEAHGPDLPADGGAQLGGEVARVADRSKNPVSADPAQGDIPGPVSIGVATAVPAATPSPRSQPTRRNRKTSRRSPRRASPPSATRTSSPTRISASKATATSS